MSELKIVLNTGGAPGEKGERGERGEQGIRGRDGARGPIGPRGEKGDTGEGIHIIAALNDPSDLPPSGLVGDSYLIENDLYIHNGTAYINTGPVRGPQGLQGDRGPEGPPGPEWIVWRDAFAPSTQYNVGDGVFLLAPSGEARIYRCINSHTSGQTITDTNWQLIFYSPPGPTGERGEQGERGLQGLQGDMGLEGPRGEQGPSGRLLDAWKGPWEEDTEYDFSDMVLVTWPLEDATYTVFLICHTPHTSPMGAPPDINTYDQYWTIFVQLRDGIRGVDGVDGVNASTIAFDDEQEYRDYTPLPNEIVVLVDA